MSTPTPWPRRCPWSPPYLNDWQIVAGVARAFQTFLREGWADTRSATGPEAGRPSSHQHEVTLPVAIGLHLILVELEWHLNLGKVKGVGWALADLYRENLPEVYAYQEYLPNVHAQLHPKEVKQ